MHLGMHAGRSYGHWLPSTLVAVFSVEGCFGARKQDMKFFLSFHQAKAGQLDKQYTCFWTTPVCMGLDESIDTFDESQRDQIGKNFAVWAKF
jgi:hypothetical protein